MLTQDQIDNYVTRSGVSCPVCYCDQIEGDTMQVDAGSAWQDVTCTKCGETWTDVYSPVTAISNETGRQA